MADFDGNGLLDLATASEMTALFLVQHQVGIDTWNVGIGYGLGQSRAAVGVADFQSDGAPDLFVVNRSSSTLEVRKNLGNGTFANLSTYPTSIQPSDTAAIDFDLDLDLDIVVSCQSNTNQILVFLNQGNGTFVPGVQQSVPNHAHALAAFDLEGDGDRDVVVVSTSEAYLLKNLGNGAWDPAFVTIPGAGGQDVVASDFDLDGDPDWAVLNSSSGDARIFLQNAGVYSLAGSVMFGASPRALVAGDFDEDGDADLACTQFTSGTVRVALNQGAANFVVGPPTSVGPDPTALLAIDSDRDGDLDLAAATRAPSFGSVRILHGDGTGRFSLPSYPTQAPAHLLRNADMNGDGRQDMVVTHDAVAALSVHLDQGLARYDVAVTYPLPAGVESLELMDFDGDQDVDVVLHPVGTTNLMLLRNDGSGVLTTSTTTIPVGAFGRVSEVADVDGDSDPDVVTIDRGAHTVSISKLVGPESFAPPVAYTFPGEPWDAAALDIDADGDLDLTVSSHYSSWRIYLFENDGTGAFSTRPPIVVTANLYELDHADVDLDGDQDLIASSDYNYGYTFINEGAWNFNVVFWTSAGAYHYFRVGDFTGDGLPDLAMGGELTNDLMLMSGSGSGVFTTTHKVPAELVPLGIVAHDLDSDGNTDFVLANWSSATLTVHFSCGVVASAICVGDGVGTACPCGNLSALGAKAGCANSTGAGATLRASGSRSLAHDTLVLATTGAPSTATVQYLQGTAAINGGIGVAFGDGLRCVGGTVTRLGARPSVAGASSFPAAYPKRVGQMGNVTTPGVRFYQAWYRDAATFCTAGAFNLTNGVLVTWVP